MKRFAYILIGLGTLVMLFTALADALGSGRDGGLGAAQILGLLVGAGAVLAGVGLLVARPDRATRSQEDKGAASDLLELPLIAWVAIPFLVEYLLFFALPMFLSKERVQYFTRYIPDAYITHIGFDIEATVSRINTWLVSGVSPYTDGFLLYTPLVFVLLAPLIVLGYPAYYRFMVLLSLAGYGLILHLASRLLPKSRAALLLLIFILGLFSYGLQFELERGQFNLVAMALTLSALYLFHYQPRWRYFAYLLFSLAIQLKLYPVLFIFLFVEDWRAWKVTLRRFVALGLSNFALLFVLGWDFFVTFLGRVTSVQLNYQSSRLEDLSLTGFVYNLTTDGFDLLGPGALAAIAPHARLIRYLLLAIFLACFVYVLASAWRQRRAGFDPYLFLLCTLGAMLLPSQSADYKLSILVAPFALVLASLPELQARGRKLAQGLLVCLASLAYWSTFYPAGVKPYPLSRNFPALFVILVAVTLLHRLHGGKHEIREAPAAPPDP